MTVMPHDDHSTTARRAIATILAGLGRVNHDGDPRLAPRCRCGATVRGRRGVCEACSASDRAEMLTLSFGPVLAPLPAWEWARFGRPEMRAVSRRLYDAAEAWSPEDGNLVLLDPTSGAGKTASAVAIIHRLVDDAMRPGATHAERTHARGIRYLSAYDLATARRNHPLGAGEAPLIRQAKRATLLVIDEVGFERAVDTAIPDVLNARYQMALPTVVTAGMTEPDFAAYLGDAVKRKLCGRGQVVSAGGRS